LPNISKNHVATWWQKLAADFPSNRGQQRKDKQNKNWKTKMKETVIEKCGLKM
jgi:hypothetical protein